MTVATPLACRTAYLARTFFTTVRFKDPCRVVRGLRGTLRRGGSSTVGTGVRVLGGIFTSVRSGSCSRRMSHGMTGTLFPLCTRVVPTRRHPGFCGAVRGRCGKSCGGFISTVCSSSVVTGRTGFSGFVGGPAMGTVRGSLTARCSHKGCRGLVRLESTLRTRSRGLSSLRGVCVHNLNRVGLPIPSCPSTGFALHLACNGIGPCDPESNIFCGCCAAASNVLRGRGPRSHRFGIPTGLGRLVRGGSFKHCTVPGNSVPIYFLSAGSVANNGSKDPILGRGNRLVNYTFSNG